MNQQEYNDGILIFTSIGSGAKKRLNLHSYSNEDFNGMINLLSKECLVPIEYKSRMNINIYSPKDNVDWEGMPSRNYNMELLNRKSIRLYFYENEYDFMINFIRSTLSIDNHIRNGSLSYNKRETWAEGREYLKDKDPTDPNIQPKYPIYIISKGRYKKRRTADYLNKCGVKYRMVVEPHEYQLYIDHGQDENTLLIMPDEFKADQLAKGYGGGIPVRNFVHIHSRDILKTDRHWILDDNIQYYTKLVNSKRVRCYSPVNFRAVEDYTDRYENVGISGHNYSFFCITPFMKPCYKNTKIYSSILINNHIHDEMWRGVYNEDVDLILRTLKKGIPTLCINQFNASKMRTMICKGGNTTSIYASKEAHNLKAQSLFNQHPDIVKIIERYNRIHHYVNYNGFKDIPLLKKPNYHTHPDTEYGLISQSCKEFP